MLRTFRASGINQNLKTSLLRKDFWQPVYHKSGRF